MTPHDHIVRATALAASCTRMRVWAWSGKQAKFCNLQPDTISSPEQFAPDCGSTDLWLFYDYKP